jgi:excisionase family DNA binding protein
MEMNSDLAARLTYTVPEAGRRLGVSRGVAYLAAARGEIPTIRIGRRLLVPRAALDRLLGKVGLDETPEGFVR